MSNSWKKTAAFVLALNIEIPMKILSDEKGYLDRQCPNENCLFEFKVNMQDWEDKVSDEEVHCPLCGHVAPSESWYTFEQLDAMQEIAAYSATAAL